MKDSLKVGLVQVFVTKKTSKVKIKSLLEQQGLAVALEELPVATIVAYDNVIQKKAFCVLISCLGDRVLWEITKETSMHRGKSQSEHIDEFHKLVGDFAAINTVISDEDQALLLLISLPSSYDNFVDTLLYGRDTSKLEDVLAMLNSKELQKMTKAKGDGGEGLYVTGRSGQRDMEHGTYNAWLKSQVRSSRLGCYICQSEEHLKRDCLRYNHKKSQGFVKNEDQVSGSGADGDYLVDFEEYDGGNILLGDGRECRIWGTEDTTISTYLVNRSPSSTIGFKTPVDMLRFFGWLASIKQGMLKSVKVKCIFLGYRKGIVGNKLWRLDNVTSKVVLYKNTGFNKNGEYNKTFIGSGVGTGSVHVLQGVKFEVEPQEDHTFEVEPHGNADHVASSQEVQTQDLIYYHLARDGEQHSTHKLFSYREDNKEAAFAVAEADKIYAHESLTLNNTVAYEVISKWKAGLKDDIDAWSDMYVLSNGCRKCSDNRDGYYWEYTPGTFIHLFLYIDDMVFSCRCNAEIWATKGLLDKAKRNVLGMEIARDQSGNTLRVSQSRFYNGKLVQTLLEGHSILLSEGSLSGECDVEKNEYIQLEIREVRNTLIQYMEYVKKLIDKRALHKREYEIRVNEKQMQTTEEKVDTSKALDASLVETQCRGTKSKKDDTSSSSGNNAHIDDVDIKPVYDEEPTAELQLTAECYVFATRQQHTKQPEFNNEGEVDQNVEQYYDIRPLPA
nr:zinc finger, CCHC-type [Tanacetum cinerariifolium]